VFVTLLEATGINLNVYVVVGCVGGVVVGLLNLHNQSDMLTHSLWQHITTSLLNFI